jgi:hypothetical protein
MRLLALIPMIFALGCATAVAQPFSFASLEGQWRGQGTFRGAPSEVSATIEPLFDGAAWSLDIDIRFAAANGQAQRFQGRGGYALRAGAPVGGSWVDNFGNAYAINPRIEGDALIVDWGQGGRSEYRIEPDGDLRIEDSIGGRSFAVAELRRAE